jgi:hypothetical protein
MRSPNRQYVGLILIAVAIFESGALAQTKLRLLNIG